MTAKLGPNALLPCGSDTAKRRHVALAEHCDVCGTQGRRAPLPTLQALVLRRRLLRPGRGAA